MVDDRHDAAPRVRLEPKGDRWAALIDAARDAESDAARDATLTAATGASPQSSDAGPVIATGHQAWHWHPGIFAKYLAADALATRLGGRVVHVVVDHDVYHPLQLDVPVQRGGVLSAARLDLSDAMPADARLRVGQVPVALLPAANVPAIVRHLAAWPATIGATPACALDRLIEAWERVGQLEPAPKLIDQATAWLGEAMSPWLRLGRDELGGVESGRVETVYATALLREPAGLALLRALLDDTRAAVAAYNAAVAARPGAGINPLHLGTDVAELPLWLLDHGRSRRSAWFVALDGDRAAESDRLIAAVATGTLTPAPRALTLTALMRSARCDFFIHGTGGGVYDRVTEAWWRRWRGQVLAPMAVATADLWLPFDASLPLAEPEHRRDALWYRHHLPHNIDRELNLDASDPRVARKHELLAHMDDDRDKARRAAAFAELHRINDQLAAEHADALERAEARVYATSVGVRNRRLATRRDWCFALYPHDRLDALADRVRAALNPTT